MTAFPAFAQDTEEEADDEIVVTGTLLRGSKPVGANPITLDDEALTVTGATTGNELLATIPQVSNYFNTVPVRDLAIATNQIQISRPNLRNISGNNSSSSGTLILVDGHRIASIGVRQASIDPDVIPPGAIERVEVVTEGGSATYGADAVAGVINFITKRKVDGVEVGGRYGLAKNYWQADASITAGTDWDSGSAYITYTHTRNDDLFGRDRDFIRNLNYASSPYLGQDRTCTPANLQVNNQIFIPGIGFITLSSVSYAQPGFAPNTFNACDNTDNSSFIPKAQRHGALLGFSQDFGDATTLDVRAFYSQRNTESRSDLTGNVNIGTANPFRVNPVGAPPTGAQSVQFSFAPLGLVSHSTTDTNEWGANAELKRELGANWQARALINFSASDTSFGLTGVNSTRLNAAGAAATVATAFNPYNLGATNPAIIADVIDDEIAGQAKDNLFNVRGILDGTLLALPAGDVRLALGYELMKDDFKQRYQSNIRIGTLDTFAFNEYDRTVHSGFGELQIPLFSEENSGLHSFVVSVSGRYDKYSDFGSTFNPKVGATIMPFDWFTIRGNWGTSFTAPTPLDQLGSLTNQISSFPFVAFTRPGDTPAPGSRTVAVQGSVPNLQPQTADTWSVGFDMDAPFLEGLRTSLSYYVVNFNDILGTPTPNAGIFVNFPDNVQTNVAGLSAAQLTAFAALAPNGLSVVNPLITSGAIVYETVDFRTGNFGVLRVKGLDFAVNYNLPTSFGSLDFGFNGNHQLMRDQQASPVAAVDDLLVVGPGDAVSNLTLQTTLGATISDFRASATWNRSGGYDIPPTTSVPVQSRVGAFNTVNLFFGYDIEAEGLLGGTSLTLNINNVFDQDPPLLLRNQPNELGFANGFTFGRMFTMGLSKKF